MFQFLYVCLNACLGKGCPQEEGSKDIFQSIFMQVRMCFCNKMFGFRSCRKNVIQSRFMWGCLHLCNETCGFRSYQCLQGRRRFLNRFLCVYNRIEYVNSGRAQRCLQGNVYAGLCVFIRKCAGSVPAPQTSFSRCLSRFVLLQSNVCE